MLAFAEDVAASGGYWLACAADEIFAMPGSIVGSIGVVSAGFGFSEAIGRLGIERRMHTAGTQEGHPRSVPARSGRRTWPSCARSRTSCTSSSRRRCGRAAGGRLQALGRGALQRALLDRRAGARAGAGRRAGRCAGRGARAVRRAGKDQGAEPTARLASAAFAASMAARRDRRRCDGRARGAGSCGNASGFDASAPGWDTMLRTSPQPHPRRDPGDHRPVARPEAAQLGPGHLNQPPPPKRSSRRAKAAAVPATWRRGLARSRPTSWSARAAGTCVPNGTICRSIEECVRQAQGERALGLTAARAASRFSHCGKITNKRRSCQIIDQPQASRT